MRKVNGVHTQKVSTTKGIKSAPAISTVARCLLSLAYSPSAAATPVQKVEEEI